MKIVILRQDHKIEFRNQNYKPSNFFYDDLEKTIEHAGKHVFLSKGDKRRFCEFIQYHALAPQASFNAFMSLMWNAFLGRVDTK